MMNGTVSWIFHSSLRGLGNAMTWRLTQRRKQNSLIKLQSGGKNVSREREREMARLGKTSFEVFSQGKWQAEQSLLCKLRHLKALVILHTVHKHACSIKIPVTEQTRLPVTLYRIICREPHTLVRRPHSGYTLLCRPWPWLIVWRTCAFNMVTGYEGEMFISTKHLK